MSATKRPTVADMVKADMEGRGPLAPDMIRERPTNTPQTTHEEATTAPRGAHKEPTEPSRRELLEPERVRLPKADRETLARLVAAGEADTISAAIRAAVRDWIRKHGG